MPANENTVDDPQFWRFRAEEVRSIADDMKVVEARAIMTRIAEDYERIAKLVEQSANASSVVQDEQPDAPSGN